MQELGLMERFADPALFDSLTLGEKTTAGLITTLMGMGTTFVVLIVLWGVIVLMTKLIYRPEGKKVQAAEKPRESNVAAAVPAPGPVNNPGGEIGPDIIAVISAAIAASSEADERKHLVIRKINRISGNRAPWNMAGSADCIDSRKF
jgi:sodium pump decarboxylase gamma subunit